MNKDFEKINATLIWNNMLKGDQASLSKLFELYFSDLTYYGIKLFNLPDLVQDSIQDVFLRIWETRNALGEVNNPKAYILASFRRKVLENKKKLKTETSVDMLSSDELKKFHYEKAEFIEFEDSPNQLHEQLINTVNKLPEKQRELIFLRFYLNLRYAHIAKIMEVNEQTVRNLMQRAIANLRKKIDLKDETGMASVLFLLFSKKK